MLTNCKICEKEFTIWPSLLGKKVTCSKTCSRKYLSKIHKGKRPKNWEMASKKAHEALKGKPAWNKGLKMSQSFKDNVSKALKGRIHSGSWLKNHIPWNKGKHLTDEDKAKKSKAQKEIVKSGKHNWWKGGITPLRGIILQHYKTRQWRSDVFTRDNFTCQLCGKNGGILNAHHIKMFSVILNDYSIKTLEDAINCEELWNINNGMTLCKECHLHIHSKNL